MTNLLLRLYPSAWRKRYEDEFRALLEDTGSSPRSVVNVALGAVRMQARYRRDLLTTALFLLGFGLLEAYAVRSGFTENIFWRPDSFVSLTLLVAVISCLTMALRPVWAPVARKIHS